jgi:hypothetical protein
VTQPYQTFTNKLNSGVSLIVDLFSNTDFKGDPILYKGATKAENSMEVLKYMWDRVVPSFIATNTPLDQLEYGRAIYTLGQMLGFPVTRGGQSNGLFSVKERDNMREIKYRVEYLEAKKRDMLYNAKIDEIFDWYHYGKNSVNINDVLSAIKSRYYKDSSTINGYISDIKKMNIYEEQ